MSAESIWLVDEEKLTIVEAERKPLMLAVPEEGRQYGPSSFVWAYRTREQALKELLTCLYREAERIDAQVREVRRELGWTTL